MVSSASVRSSTTSATTSSFTSLSASSVVVVLVEVVVVDGVVVVVVLDSFVVVLVEIVETSASSPFLSLIGFGEEAFSWFALNVSSFALFLASLTVLASSIVFSNSSSSLPCPAQNKG